MDRYPYLRIKNRRLCSFDMRYSIRDVIKRTPPNKPLYLLDEDGVTDNRPNYNIYQRLSGHADLWIDAGPRTVEDVMDIVMAGATAVIFRPSLWPMLDVDEILNITDCSLYAVYESPEVTMPPKMNGLIIPYSSDLLMHFPLSLSQHSLHLLNLTNTDVIPNESSWSGAFLDFPFFITEEHP